MTTQPPMSWWDAARYTAPLSIAELEVEPYRLDRLRELFFAVLDTVPRKETNRPSDHCIRLPRGTDVTLVVEPENVGIRHMTCLDASNRPRFGVRVVPTEQLAPLDARWIAGRGWSPDRPVPMPWAKTVVGAWRDPGEADINDLNHILCWILFCHRAEDDRQRSAA